MEQLNEEHIKRINSKTLKVKSYLNSTDLNKNFTFFNAIDKSIFINIEKDKYGAEEIIKIYYLPITSTYWDDFVNIKGLKTLFSISNYGLAINKFGRFNSDKLDYIASNGQDNLYHKFVFKDHWDIIEYSQNKQNNIKDDLKQSFEISEIKVSQNWRLVLNLGETTAYNNGFLLHPIYGIPYLSDTSIKGMIRTYVIENYFDFKEDKAQKNEVFINLFGIANKQDSDKGQQEPKNNLTEHLTLKHEQENDKGHQGFIKFAQAFPINTITDPYTIEADIINNHNEDYYADDNAVKYPSDSIAPIPIKFITLKNAIFEPYFYIDKQHISMKIIKVENDKFTEKLNGKTLLEAMSLLMIEAFKIKGIGAKTNIGYGRLIDETLPMVYFDTIQSEKTTTKVYIKDDNLKIATLNLDGELKDIHLIIPKGIDKTKLKIGQIIEVIIQQISIPKHIIVAVKLK